MKPDIYRISALSGAQLAIMPRPRAGDWLEDELKGLMAEGYHVVVSLLTRPDEVWLGLENEGPACAALGLQYISHPIEDHNVPHSMEAVHQLVRNLDALLRDGKGIAIHCFAGIGRSGTIASCVLIARGFKPEAAIEACTNARGTPSPETRAQRQWVRDFYAYWLANANHENDSGA